ncbi:hypothetical protein [Ferrimonas marina]|uniref:Uncharacterized protein n=1 Tax=Ferrimonas marina TaxID=299255 RepID=A0A1M5Z9W7_9GAMM|nr:hypothetical protein [Ferrimonas marina]SHI20982.1 hypothetical protein SAMN02745129_0064 [Ferrimonas marina]
MAKNRRRYNNMLILLVAGAGLLLLSLGQLTGPREHSLPLLPPESRLQGLVFADLALQQQDGAWQSQPALTPAQTQALLDTWQQAQMVAIAPPQPLPRQPIQVDLYLAEQDAPITLLLYPQLNAIKLLEDPQWWRLVNQAIDPLLPPSTLQEH